MPVTYTIGIPVTRVRYLAETLAGLAAQTERDFEVHVVDNGADGDVAAIVGQFPGLAAQVVRRERQLPPVENWNELLRTVTTPWFVLLSDDDYFEPDHLAGLRALSARWPQAGVLHTRVRVVDGGRNTRFLTATIPEWEPAVDYLWHRLGGHRNQFLSEFAWRTEDLRAIGGFQELPQAWGTDDLTALLVARKGGIAYGKEATLNYRMHAQSITQSARVGGKLQALEQLCTAYQQFLRTLDCGGEARLTELRRETLALLPHYRRRHQVDLLSGARWADLAAAAFAPNRLGRKVVVERGVPIRGLARKIKRKLT